MHEMYMYTHIYIHTYIYTHIYMHIYTCTYTHVHTHTYTHIYMHKLHCGDCICVFLCEFVCLRCSQAVVSSNQTSDITEGTGGGITATLAEGEGDNAGGR